jgi:hypothetical protein
MAVAGPPGGLGEAGRAVVLPVAGVMGESEDWKERVSWWWNGWVVVVVV